MWTPSAMAVATIAAGAFGAWMGPVPVRETIGDTIAVFAILAAFLIQVMLLLVTAFSPGNLGADRIRQVTEALSKQQRRASWVFLAYLVAIVSAVVAKAAMPTTAGAVAPIWLHGLTGIGFMCATFGLLGTLMFVRSLRAIQTLRHRLMIEEAEMREAAARREAFDSVAFLPTASPSSSAFGKKYGS